MQVILVWSPMDRKDAATTHCNGGRVALYSGVQRFTGFSEQAGYEKHI